MNDPEDRNELWDDLAGFAFVAILLVFAGIVLHAISLS